MLSTSLSALLCLAVSAPLVFCQYENGTFGNEYYYRAGWAPYVYSGGEEANGLFWNGFSESVLAMYYGTDEYGQGEYGGCDGLCPSSFPFGVQFNTTQSLNSVNLAPYEYATYGFDLYSVNFGCFAIGPNGTDAQGQTTFGRVARDCKITTEATNTESESLSHTFDFKAQGIPSNLTLGAWPANFRNLTSVYFNATSEPAKDFPNAPVVAFDDLAYGYYIASS